MEWLPIETAPKDGTTVDLWVKVAGVGQRMENIYWCRGYEAIVAPLEWWAFRGRHGGWLPKENESFRITHWMPLPHPPQKER